jgi:hypothetical protein
MAINENNLSNSGGGQRFKFWTKPFAPEKKIIDDNDDSTDSTAVVGIKPVAQKTSKDDPKVGSAGPSSRSGRANPNPKVTGKRDYADRNPINQSESVDDETQFDSHKPQVSIERPKIKLDPFQESIYYSLIPVENTVEAEVNPYNSVHGSKQDGIERLPITTSSVIGESGSGLTLMLAKKAYENYQDGRPTIILTHRKHLFHKMAQSIIDFSEPSKREKLLSNIEVISGKADFTKIDPNKKIYIVSADKLLSYLKDNDSFRPQDGPRTLARMAWTQPAHNRIRDILPLRKIREVLIDEANMYTGSANDGYTKLLATLLKETSSDPERNPVHLFGTSSTPYPRGESQDPSYPTLEFNRLFPELSCQKTPSPRELIEEAKFYKRPTLSTINLDKEIQREMQHIDAKLRLLYSGEGSINDNIVSLYQKELSTTPGKKWHIIANDIDHANQLCALFNSKQINAKVATSDHTGYFKPLSEPLSETDSRRGIFDLNDTEVKEQKTQLRKVRQQVNQIIDEYESGDCNVIIDIDFKSCIHSTKTDKVVVLNLEETDSRTKHYLGEAVRDRSGPQNQNIEYLFLKPHILESFKSLITGNNLDLDAIPKTRSSRSNGVDFDPLRTETDMSVEVVGGIIFNQNWLNHGLRSVLETKYEDLPLEQALINLTQDFHSSRSKSDKSLEELKDIIAGLNKDTEVFDEFVSFIEGDLRKFFQNELLRTNIDLKQELTILVPDLMGVSNELLAQRVLNKSFEDLVMNDSSYNPDEEWQQRMDQALGLSSQERGEVRENTRNKLFAKIIAKKFGLEFFENKFFLQKALKVFNGAEVDFKLFGLLVNVLSSKTESASGFGFSFDNIREEFPHLLGSQRVVPFAALQRKILAKYPEGPPIDQSLTRFFGEQLYDDFAIDFATLINSVTNHSRATDPDQEIINGSVQDDIYKFLESVYELEANLELPKESGLRPSDNRFKLEINAKAQEHLSTITKEVLYTQLIAKIWGQSRSVKINNDDFVFELSADELILKPAENSSLEDAIDLTKVNADWLLTVDHAVTGSSFDRVDIKKRIAAITSSFLAQKHNIGSRVESAVNTKQEEGDEYLVIAGDSRKRYNITEAQVNPQRVFLDRDLNSTEIHELNVLLGSTPLESLTDSDKDLLREFAKFNKMNVNKLLPRFYSRLGVQSLEEAKTVVKDKISNLGTINQSWIDLFGTKEEYIDFVTEYVYSNTPNAFDIPDSLEMMLTVLAGDMTGKYHGSDAQDYNREFIEFVNSKNLDLKFEDLVLSFREQIGLKTKSELFALMRQPGFVDFEDKKSSFNPNRYDNRTPDGVQKFIAGLAEKLEISSTALFALAGLKEPNNFYREPLIKFIDEWKRKIDFDSFTQDRIIDELGQLLSNNSNSIKARQLLIDVFGEEYKLSSVFTLPEPIADTEIGVAKLRVDINGNKITFTDEQPNPKYGKPKESKRLDKDFQEYAYLDGDWKLTSTQQDVNQRYYRVANLVTGILKKDFQHLDSNWLAQLGISEDSQDQDPSVQRLVIAIDSFMRYMMNNDNVMKFGVMSSSETFQGFVSAFLGDQRHFTVNRPAVKQSFRDFIEFINTKPDLFDGVRNPLHDNDLGPIDLNQVIKESPKLTGIRTLDELKLAIGHACPNFRELADSFLKTQATVTAPELLEFFSKLTTTPVSDLINFPEIQTKVQKYIEGLHKLDLLPSNFIDAASKDPNFPKTVLLHELFDEAKFEYYSHERLNVEHDGKDYNLLLTISYNRIQFDVSQKATPEEHSLIVSFDNLELGDKDIWQEKPISDNEFFVRTCMLCIMQNEVGHTQLPKISAQLNDAYDKILTKGVDNNSLFLLTTNLFTEFLQIEKPEIFEHDDLEDLLKVVMSLLAIEPETNLELINKFIDFAKTKDPKFEDIRKDPRFEEVFFNIPGRKTEKFLNFIRAEMTPQNLLRLVKSKKDPRLILVSLINSAEGKGFAPPQFDELVGDLKLNADIKSHVLPGFVLLASLISPKMHGIQDQSQLLEEIKKLPLSMPEEYQARYLSLMILKEIFPDFDFGKINTNSETNMIPVEILDQNGKKFDDYEFTIEFDGKSLIFWKVSHPLREVGKVGEIERLIKVDFDKVMNSWTIDQNATMPNTDSVEAKIIEQIKSNTTKDGLVRSFITGKSRSLILENLINQGESVVRSDSFRLPKFYEFLGIPSLNDMRANIKFGLETLVEAISAKASDLPGITEIEAGILMQKIRTDIIPHIPDFKIKNDRDHAALKVLFPDLQLDHKNTGAVNHLILGKTLEVGNKQFALEFDGRNFNLLRKISNNSFESVLTVYALDDGSWSYSQ